VEDEKGAGIHGKYGGEKKCIKDPGGATRKKETTWKTQA
jgi:hypothetical protein